jgi:hypothetical protein
MWPRSHGDQLKAEWHAYTPARSMSAVVSDHLITVPGLTNAESGPSKSQASALELWHAETGSADFDQLFERFECIS